MKLRDVMQADVPTASPEESATVAWERMSALDLMQRNVRTAGPGTSVARAAASMQGQRLGCLLIVERHKLVGMVTTTEMLGILARGTDCARSSHR